MRTTAIIAVVTVLLTGCSVNVATQDDVTKAAFGPASEILSLDATAVASSYESKAHGGWGDFPPALTLDGDMTANSSWRAETTDKSSPQWIQYDLGQPHTIKTLKVAFVKGESRNYFFSVGVSADGINWASIFEGASRGQTSDFEEFSIDYPNVRYLKITGTGNTNEKFPNWTNITEVEIWGY